MIITYGSDRARVSLILRCKRIGFNRMVYHKSSYSYLYGLGTSYADDGVYYTIIIVLMINNMTLAVAGFGPGWPSWRFFRFPRAEAHKL